MDFDVVVEVPNNDSSKLSDGTHEETTEQPREPKKEPEDATTPGGGGGLQACL